MSGGGPISKAGGQPLSPFNQTHGSLA